MSQNFVFRDKELDTARKSSQSKIENFQKILDETTEDIRTLEKWLQETGFCMQVCLHIQSESISLLWKRQRENWRLIYEDSAGFEKPLLEGSARTRIAVKPYLPQLLNEIERFLPEVPEADEDEADPFFDADLDLD